MEGLIRPFSAIGKNDAGIAGGKGASLGEMTQAGIPVPPGFVVLAPTFERFIEETDLNVEIDAILGTVNHEEMHTVEHASAKIQSLILAAKMPEDIGADIKKHFTELGAEFVAVRSSATAEDSASAAWAGQLDTYLNTTEAELLTNVQRCWASLFTPRAIFYRFEKELHATKISVAVVVQKMVNSDASGIAFSVHPVTEDRNQLIIEAGWGLGEAIVSGQITPDAYVVTKVPREILDKNIAKKERGMFRKEGGGNDWKEIEKARQEEQTLTDAQILEFTELIMRIENHYGFPCDIEWAMEAGVMYITQSRPITTLSGPSVADSDAPESLRMEYLKMGRWAMLPADVETWHTEHTSRYFKEYFGIYKDVLPVCFLGKDFYNIMFIGKPFIAQLYKDIDAWLAKDFRAVEKRLMRFYKDKKEAHREVPKISAKDYGALTPDELIALYRKNRDWVHRVVVFDQFGWIVEDKWNPLLEATLKKYGLMKGTTQYNDALFKLIKPREISTTLEEKRDLIKSAIKIKRGKSSLEVEAKKMTEAYAWMPVLAFGTPWNEEWYRRELPEVMKKDETELKKELKELESYTKIRDRDFNHVVKTYGMTKKDVQIFIEFGLLIDTRNEAEYLNSLCGFYLLSFYDEFSRRLGITVDEVRTLFEDELVACIEGKANARELLEAKQGTVVWGCVESGRTTLTGKKAEALAAYAEAHSTMVGANAVSDENKGVPASPGKAKGIARIIPTPNENDRVGTGDILVTYATTVDYLPAMKKAAAIVTEVGGLTCHAAVVSREFGIPCVVGLKGAMTKFKDGEVIEVDADVGVVTSVGTPSVTFKSAPPVSAGGASEPFSHAWDSGHWTQIGRWVQTPFTYGFFIEWMESESARVLYPSHAFGPAFTVDGYFYVETEDLTFVSEDLIAKHGARTLADFVGTFDGLGEALRVKYRQLFDTGRVETVSLAELMELHKEMNGFWSFVTFIGDAVNGAALKCNVAGSEADFFDLVHPHLRTSWIEDEEKRIREIAQTLLDAGIEEASPEVLSDARTANPKLDTLLSAYSTAYAWLGINKWEGEPNSPEQFAMRVNDAIANTKAGNYVAKHEAVQGESVDPLVEIAVSTAYWRATCSGLAEELALNIRARITDLGKKNDLSYSECLLLTYAELVALERGQNLAVPREELKKRQNGYAIYYEHGGVLTTLTSGNEVYEKLKSQYAKPPTQSAEVLKGVTARKGKVQGRVCIVTGNTDFAKFKEGDILVAPETTPAYVPLMRKASAILTERGGITSHAAIVSRELGVPCVISIVGLISALKDGDAVEVDAGVVRKVVVQKQRMLAKMYSREKPLFYFALWQADDREGMKRYLNIDIKDDLYIIPPPGTQGSIWFPKEDFEHLMKVAFEKINESHEFAESLIAHARKYWALVRPYLVEKKRCDDAAEMYEYYRNLVEFWIPMNSVFFMLPDRPGINPVFKEGILTLRTETQEYTEEMPRVFTDFFAKRFPSLTHLAYYISPEETLILDKELTPALIEELKTRARDGCFMFGSGIYPMSKLAGMLTDSNLAFEKLEGDGSEISGQTAYKGNVQGLVCIVLAKSDMAKVKKGDVLVTPMTNPDMVPVMKIAGAVVTDEGGMTCHAAIASREMKVPCVVGTKFATQVLKDGDLVEVDADKGIVRKVGG